MCIIIYIPENQTISKQELQEAFNYNNDGGGFAYIKNNYVYFKKGFFKFNELYNQVKDIIGRYPLVLHFRITSRGKTTKKQTHPFKKTNLEIMKGITKDKLIFMNGTIYNQTTYKNYNDTQSYIKDHQQAFRNINQDILNIIGEATDSRWAVVTPEEVLITKDFINQNGIYYSNLNHQITDPFRNFYKYHEFKISDLIEDKKLRKQIRKNKLIYNDLTEFIWANCNFLECKNCIKCLREVTSMQELNELLDNYYYNLTLQY